MARVPFFSGPIASAVMPSSPLPRGPMFSADDARRMGGSAGSLLAAVFGNPANNPERQLARQRGAAAALDEEKLAAARRGNEARTGLQSVLDEINYRTDDSAAGSQPIDVLPETERIVLPAAPVSEEDEARRIQAASGSAFGGALATGDVKELTPIMQAFNLGRGDDNAIVRTNAAMEAKYLGKDDSPSLGAQKELIEDGQRHDMEKHEGEQRMKKYGFDTASADRRYDTDVDADTARRGQDVSAGTARRGQDITDERGRRGQDLTDTRQREFFDRKPANAGYTETTMKQKGKNGEKTVKTRRPAGAGAARPAKGADPLGIR